MSDGNLHCCLLTASDIIIDCSSVHQKVWTVEQSSTNVATLLHEGMYILQCDLPGSF